MESDACTDEMIRQHVSQREWMFHPAEMKEPRTMISKSVSRLTVNGMFLITIAVGITSSSLACPGVPGARGTCMCCIGGEPPDDISELVGGDIERERRRVCERERVGVLYIAAIKRS